MREPDVNLRDEYGGHIDESEAQFQRSRWGQLIDLNKAGPYAMLKAYCGQFAEALDLLERARKKKPLDMQIRLAIMNVKQLAGDFSPPQWHDPRVLDRARSDIPHRPLWDGTPMPGETLLLWDVDAKPRRATGPGGFGLGDIVIIQVPKALAPLMRSLSGSDLIVDHVADSGFDKQLPLVLTPSIVRLTDEIFGSVPYLDASPEAIERWAPMFADGRFTHIGLHYAADPQHQSARERSIPLTVHGRPASSSRWQMWGVTMPSIRSGPACSKS